MHHLLTDFISQKISFLFNGCQDYFIAPPFCAYCKDFLTRRTIFCKKCYQKIHPIVSVRIPLTKTQGMTVLAISDYQEPLKSLILAKAWSDITACNQIADLIWNMTYFKHMPCDYLVPVPLHWMRYARRGYNQAEEIARGLTRYKNVPVATLVKRVKNTPFQSSIAQTERMANVKEAFVLRDISYEKYANKHIILVDDLMTTGSTLVSVAKALAPLKPASLVAVVAARVC